mmetsp:Transcript_33758/g.52799  ORF Transcript_33758/g.52799 Transcript_33758/m.52799 type:complete len:234 (-) Transcript_33758:40-741(-)
MSTYLLIGLSLLAHYRVSANTDFYDELDDIQPKKSPSKIDNDKTYVRKSILQRLVEYAHDGTELLTNKKQTDSYYAEIYKLCGENTTCIDHVIKTMAKGEGGTQKKDHPNYDQLIAQMVTDFKEWLSTEQRGEPKRNRRKKRKNAPKKVRFEDADEETKRTLVDELRTHEKATAQRRKKKHSQTKIWVMGIIFCIFGFLLRKLLKRAFAGRLPISSYWLESRPMQFIREYLFV